MLGYGGHDDWRDMSEFLVHLTKKEPMTTILNEKLLKPGKPMGTARNLTIADSQRAVCLSEIPLDRLDRLVGRHGTYGIGFRKKYIRAIGGAPVWYLWRNTTAADNFQALINEALTGSIDHDHHLWKVTPFIDNPGSGDWGKYEFDWEREWRVVGEISFTATDVSFIICPEVTHKSVRRWQEQNDGPTGSFKPDPLPPLIDLTWDLPRLQDVLAEYDLSGDPA